ncbi:MAG: carboxymuconolactone decarboxylase family protein [Deltaproteobacteria bacterium]|nr:carboxymuconolactone decarboxylase family protein [Deltaproteobacteria bacterium]
MSRLIKKSPDELDPKQREQYDRILKFRKPLDDGTIGGPFDPLILNPELAKRAVSWGNALWERASIGRRLVELAIIVTARFWESNVEWVSHAKLALDNGISQVVIDAVFEVRRPDMAPADELLVYDICMALHKTHQLPMDLYNQAVESFGEVGLVDIIATIGYYTFIAMTLNAFDIGLFDGSKGPFPLQK